MNSTRLLCSRGRQGFAKVTSDKICCYCSRKPVTFLLFVSIILFEFSALRRLTILTGRAGGSEITTCTPVRVGGNPENAWYGSWWLCEEEMGNEQTLISFGSGCDSTFEWDFLSSNPSSDCHILDPTITQDTFWTCSNSSQKVVAGYKSILSTNIPSFWPLGLSDTSKLARFSKSNDPRIGSMTELELEGYNKSSFHAILFDLQMTYTLLKITTQPILKMDIEGSEFGVISSWCQRGMPLPKPSQLLIEFHQRFFNDGRDKIESAIDCLKKLGYHKIFDNNEEEFLFVM